MSSTHVRGARSPFRDPALAPVAAFTKCAFAVLLPVGILTIGSRIGVGVGCRDPLAPRPRSRSQLAPLYVCIYIYIYIYIYIHIHMYCVYLSLSLYIYIYNCWEDPTGGFSKGGGY